MDGIELRVGGVGIQVDVGVSWWGLNALSIITQTVVTAVQCVPMKVDPQFSLEDQLAESAVSGRINNNDWIMVMIHDRSLLLWF